MDEYKKIVLKAFPKYIIDSAYDYGDILVFNMIPSDFVKDDYDEGPLNRSVSIDKKTKKVKAFLPFEIPLDTYLNGKRII